MKRARILLVSDTRDWHVRRLEAAYGARNVDVIRLDLSACGFETAAISGLHIPGFSTLPHAVHVRTMAGGSFEAITKRLGVLHALDHLGVPVANRPRAIEACVDKSMTSFLIAQAGLPTPDTWTLESFEQASSLVRRELERGPLVLKPLFGAQGKGLRLLRNIDDLPDTDQVFGVYYLQRFESVEGEGYQDFRIFTVGDAVIGMMRRKSTSWITNVKQGGAPEGMSRDANLESLALAAARATGAQIAGVDIIVGRNGPRVLEVNSMPAWSGLQKVTQVDIAGAIADHIVGGLANERHS